jgi:dienelactone hydrolase
MHEGYNDFPVLLFSPGVSGFVASYSTILTELASHGYVVIGIDHPYDATVARVRTDGAIKEIRGGALPGSRSLILKGPSDKLPERIDQHLSVWVADTIATLNWLEETQKSTDELLLPGIHNLDLSKVGVFGHSYGGATAFHTCNQDSRFKACFNIEGGQVGPANEYGGECYKNPTFQIVSSDYPCTDDLVHFSRAYKQALSDAYFLELKGIKHEAFALDIPLFSMEAFEELPWLRTYMKKYVLGEADPKIIYRIVTRALLGFFGKYLGKASFPSLDFIAEDSTVVLYTRKDATGEAVIVDRRQR